MSSYAVERNLPIFKRDFVIKQDDHFYIKGKIGSDNFIGVMNSSPRKEYFAYIEYYRNKSGIFRLGKIDYIKVNKLKLIDGDSILIEVMPNKCNGITLHSEYVPFYLASNLKFSNRNIKMSFSEWMKFIKIT